MTTITDLATTIPSTQIRNAGEPVFPELRRILRPTPQIAALIDAREAYGIVKYGQTLMTDDGRDTPTEVANELLDTLAYLAKWKLQHRDSHVFVRQAVDDMIGNVDIVLRNVLALTEELEAHP